MSAIRLQNSGSGTTFDGFLKWEFELDRLLEKSCDYLQHYLNSPVLSEENRATCDANFRSTESVSQSDISDYELLDDQEKTVDWSSLRWLLPQRQPTHALPSDLDRESVATQAFETLGSGMDLSGLGLSSSEQLIFFRLQTQVSAWDMEGSRSSLSLLQNSNNACVAAFANQLTDALNQQDGEGFRQITPIKRELNAQQGCKLPLYPYPFSP
ncbi:hypothetical protein IQ273_30730 [Nodosilinea sp. LEGE 07298]|uniref:hypothetical protein n=1 Tax=Nodosilinea sp. LEGE 07298 TaxID=2777970 RepID=UPI0019FF1C19|nr:hypothetical protein [Nodosilinea sp. LEGE 07298]MBE9113752.1 hypothetical protein [Nodosilinea sp. LEGE 07298]